MMSKKILSLLLAMMCTFCIVLSGCGDSGAPAKPSVLKAKVDYVAMEKNLTSRLSMNEEIVKKGLNGKVIEVFGRISFIGTYSNSKEPIVEYNWYQPRDNGTRYVVRAEITQNSMKNYKALRKGEPAVIRGYASVVYNQEANVTILLLEDAEVINCFSENGTSRVGGPSGPEWMKSVKSIPEYN